MQDTQNKIYTSSSSFNTCLRNMKGSKSMSIDRNTTWNSFMAQTWNRHRPPVRPSQVVMEFYGKILDELIIRNSSPSTLILGATPELRDLILSRNLFPVVVDYS